MAVGIKYDLKPKDELPELCRFDTIFRRSGGYNLVVDNLKRTGLRRLPVLAPLQIDEATRKAYPVLNVRVIEKVEATDKEIKVAKGSPVYIGMLLGSGKAGAKVVGIEHKEMYDILSIEKEGITATKDSILFEASAEGGTAPKYTANHLNYASTLIEVGATVTAIARAYEVEENKLSIPLTQKDKEGLTSRFLFK